MVIINNEISHGIADIEEIVLREVIVALRSILGQHFQCIQYLSL